MSSEEARWAVYFDFEATGGSGNIARPILLGWLWDPDPDDANVLLAFRCAVVAPEVWDAARARIPTTGETAEPLSLDDALEEILDLAAEDDRCLASWSSHDIKVIREHARTELAAECEEIWVDAHRTARRWHTKLHPDMPLPDAFPKYKLSVFLDHLGEAHPPEYGEGVAATGMQAMLSALGQGGTYSRAPKASRDSWTACLGHNHLDCVGAYRVAVKCAGELAAQG